MWNEVDILGSGDTVYFGVVENNTGTNHTTVQWNKVDSITTLFNKNPTIPGGDHVVTDNKLVGVTNIFLYTDSTGHPSTFARNGPTDGPP